MKLLLDTNIVMDYLRARDPFHMGARLLMGLGQAKEFELWISPSQLADLFYLLTKGGKASLNQLVIQELKGIRPFVNVCTYGSEEIDRALDSNWNDFEDALVYEAARSLRADAIITRNKADFEKTRIPVFDCDEFFAWYAEQTGINYAELEL